MAAQELQHPNAQEVMTKNAQMVIIYLMVLVKNVHLIIIAKNVLHILPAQIVTKDTICPLALV